MSIVVQPGKIQVVGLQPGLWRQAQRELPLRAPQVVGFLRKLALGACDRELELMR